MHKERERLLFVDFNGVISYDPYCKSLKNTEHPLHQFADRIESFVFTEHPELFQRWMIGGYTTEEFHHILSKEMNVSNEILLRSFIYDCQNIDISKPIITALQELKSQFVIVLASGNTDALERFIIPEQEELFRVFDAIDNSFHLHCMKYENGGQYFMNRAATERIPIQKSLLLEDSKKTCAVFQAIGGKAFCVNTESAVLRCIAEIKDGC